MPADDLPCRWLGDADEQDAPPGAGALASVVVALASGLTRALARSAGDGWQDASGVAAQARALRDRATCLARDNDEAYQAAVHELRTRDDRAPGPGDAQLGEALYRAGEIPVAIAEAACDVSVLALSVCEHGDLDRRPDAAATALLAAGCSRAAALLVDVNLGVRTHDPRVVRARDAVRGAALAADRAAALTR